MCGSVLILIIVCRRQSFLQDGTPRSTHRSLPPSPLVRRGRSRSTLDFEDKDVPSIYEGCVHSPPSKDLSSRYVGNAKRPLAKIFFIDNFATTFASNGRAPSKSASPNKSQSARAKTMYKLSSTAANKEKEQSESTKQKEFTLSRQNMKIRLFEETNCDEGQASRVALRLKPTASFVASESSFLSRVVKEG